MKRTIRTMKEYGFDFLKIDNQSFTLPFYMDGTQAVRQAKYCNLALEHQAHRMQLGLMNCMVQNVLNMYGLILTESSNYEVSPSTR
ncbi:hypothetical protein [Bacteroides sp. BFG-606]|uniref:hypothetical protein n=1 Tax=Bacteroides sp. BFG-606 TaxID=2972763 RepID=UPI0038D4BE96